MPAFSPLLIVPYSPAEFSDEPIMSEAPSTSISVVLPAFNEAANLRRVLEDAMETLDQMELDWEILVVDDGSTDTTALVAKESRERFPEQIRLIQHAANQGYGAALRSGFQGASKSLIFFTDSDGQFSFQDLPNLVRCLHDHDMVLGERSTRHDPWHRKVNSWLGNFLARVLLKVRVRDINCAYKLFRSRRIKGLPLESDGALINTELLAFAHRLGWSYVQIPVGHFPRMHGTPTGARLSVIIKTFAEYFSLRKRLFSYISAASSPANGFLAS